MNSEFRKLELDNIRYSLVWEDSETLYRALNINDEDDLLIITSAGCNVLNALLKNPKSVTAVDLNPSQNRLLKLKTHLIANHTFETYFALLGFLNEKEVSKALEELIKTIDITEKEFWISFFKTNKNGIANTGRLERYILAFTATLPQEIINKLNNLLSFDNVAQQAEFFLRHLDNSVFKTAFIDYFSDKNLAQGRDPKLLKYAEESGGNAFYQRLLTQIKTSLVKDNFYFRFFFFGPKNLPQKILPPCYQQKNFDLLQQNIYKLNIVNSEAIDYLSDKNRIAFNKASLSNIFEYASYQEFQMVFDTLVTQIKQPLKIVFWNLLNPQGCAHFVCPPSVKIKEENAGPQSCFYFKNALSLQFNVLKKLKSHE